MFFGSCDREKALKIFNSLTAAEYMEFIFKKMQSDKQRLNNILLANLTWDLNNWPTVTWYLSTLLLVTGLATDPQVLG